MREQRWARKIADVGQAHLTCTMPPWKPRHGSVNPPSPTEGCSLETWTLPGSCSMFSCWHVLFHGVFMSCHVQEGYRSECRKTSGCLGTDTRWVAEQRGLSPVAALKQKSRAEGMWQRPQASAPKDILRLPFLMLNKSFRIQGSQKKISEDSKSAQLFLWN